MTDRLARIASARARNLEPWNQLRSIGGLPPLTRSGNDSRIQEISRAARANRKAAGRTLLKILRGDLATVWHTFWYALKLVYGR